MIIGKELLAPFADNLALQEFSCRLGPARKSNGSYQEAFSSLYKSCYKNTRKILFHDVNSKINSKEDVNSCFKLAGY